MFTLTLIYSDGRQWIAGGFPSLDAANTWLARAQKQANWDPNTQAIIVDNTPTQSKTTAQGWLDLRAQRNSLLAACDWTQLSDSPVVRQSAQGTWATYRQSLRDLPATTSNPLFPSFPAAPGYVAPVTTPVTPPPSGPTLTTAVFSFTQALGASAAAASNYSAVSDTGLLAVTGATLASDGMSATLTLSATSPVYSGSNITITGSNLKTAAGSALASPITTSFRYYNDVIGSYTGLPLRMLAKTSSWNQLLPASPTLASYSTTQVSNLINVILHGVQNLPSGVASVCIDSSSGNIGPLYVTTAGDPTVTITQTGGYGTVAGVRPMPVAVTPAPGVDGHLTVINKTTGQEYDYYQFNPEKRAITQGAAINCTAGGVANFLTGSGWEEGIGAHGGPGPLNTGAGGLVTSAGNTLMSGVVTVDELLSGQINHALSIAVWGNAGNGGVWPATAAAQYPNPTYSAQQGWGPMPGPGSLVWSDLDDATVDALPGFDKYSKMILKAMYHYGAFVTDQEGYVAFNFRQIGVAVANDAASQTALTNWFAANTVGATTDTGKYMFSLQQQPKSWFISHFHLVDPTWLQSQRNNTR